MLCLVLLACTLMLGHIVCASWGDFDDLAACGKSGRTAVVFCFRLAAPLRSSRSLCDLLRSHESWYTGYGVWRESRPHLRLQFLMGGEESSSRLVDDTG